MQVDDPGTGRWVRLLTTGPVVALVLAGLLAVVAVLGVRSRVVEVVDGSREALARDVVASNLADVASVSGQRLQSFMSERLADVDDLSRTPALQSAIAGARSAAAAYEGLSVGDIESQFPENRRRALTTGGTAHNHVVWVVSESEILAEVIVTDANGLNVIASAQSEDMMQADETWWQVAWDTGRYVGGVTHDRSADFVSIAVAVRIDEPATGRPVGVVKGVLDAGFLRDVADEVAVLLDEGDALIALPNGRLVADTRFERDLDRLLDEDNVLARVEAMRQRAAVAPGTSGGQVTSDHAIGWSVLGEDSRGLAGWEVVLIQPSATAMQPLAGVTDLPSAVRRATTTAVPFLLVAFALLVAGVILWIRRVTAQLLEPVEELAVAATRLARGELDVTVPTTRIGPLSRIGHGLQRLRWAARHVTGAHADEPTPPVPEDVTSSG